MDRKKTDPPRLSVVTLGCRVNQYESESLLSQLKACGWTGNTGPVDVCIINTCAVTRKAAFQSRQAIRRAIRRHPESVIIATGCYAQSEPHTLQGIEGLDYIIGNGSKASIPQILSESSGKPVCRPRSIMAGFGELKIPGGTGYTVSGSRSRPLIKVQDGCDAFCTYCIVPHTRGPSRSLAPDQVIAEINSLAGQGAVEVVLSGIHLGKYGHDLNPSTSLFHLLQQIHRQSRIPRIRLSSIEPGELTPDLIDLIAASGRICRHLHIPLQSGDARILKKMNRPYSPAQFSRLVRRIRRLLPDAAIGADVMVGFPGESDAAFGNTYALIHDLPVTYLHVFPFSPRPDTPASRYPDPVPARVIRERKRLLARLGAEKKAGFYKSMTGKKIEVVIENRRDPDTGLLKSVSSNYLQVLVDGHDRLKNRLITCRTEHITGSGALTAVPVE